VKSIGATTAGASDNVVLAIATGEGRILMTEDRDFGEMAFAFAASRAESALGPAFNSPPRVRTFEGSSMIDAPSS
jgi:Domain of unknown function (DUF5615)